MSADVVPKLLFDGELETERAAGIQRVAKSNNDILNVWNGPSLNSIVDQSEYMGQEMNQPQLSSEQNEDDPTLAYEKERHQVAFLAAVKLLNGVGNEETHRKSSDSVIHHRMAHLKHNTTKKRCLSDTNGARIDVSNINVHGNDLVRFDSGIVEARPIELSSLEQTPLTLSDGESSPPTIKSVTCQNSCTTINTKSSSVKRSSSLDERVMRQLLVEDDASSHHSGASSGSRNRRTPAVKHLSQCSMGGSSTSYSSFYECTSNASIATDILSGLGFDDFDNPELIPDRFIPNEMEYAKPSLMKENAVLISCTPDVYNVPPVPPPPPPPPPITNHTNDCDLLPLGATADNFLTSKGNRSQSPPPSSPPSLPVPPHHYVDHYIERKYSVYAIPHPGLETVPEETASDLSPSPRWLSPRVSLDHSGLDLSMPHLGASLAAANRKRSLPNRDGYRISVDSMISEQDSTVYFSVTSYDDDVAKEVEEAVPPPLPTEDISVPRRRRRGVHGAPPELLSWLQANPILEEHSNTEDPWPFNEQLRLRRSLTEIEQRRSRTSSSEMVDDRSLSPLPFHDPLASIFPRRFSINGPLIPQICLPSELRRLSLPSNSSFRQYHPPAPVIEEEETDDIQSSNSIQSATTELSPRISLTDAHEYQQEVMSLKSEVDETHRKLRSSERVMKVMQDDFHRRFSDTQEWLSSELWMKERHCRELEEMLETQKRNFLQLQQNFQIRVNGAKEEVREIKDKEIKELHQKLKQKEQEHMEAVERLEEKCKHLSMKEVHLLKKLNQHGTKKEKEEFLKEIAKLKEQLKLEKEAVANVIKEKNLEIKQLRSKFQVDKEDALKKLKFHMQKLHDMEITSIKEQVNSLSFEASPSRKSYSGSLSPTKGEIKKLRLEIDRKNDELQRKDKDVQDLHQMLEFLHMEHLNLQQKIMKEKER